MKTSSNVISPITLIRIWKMMTPHTHRADDISLGADKSYHNALRTILKKHERMWYKELGEFSIKEHRIDLTTNARPFKSPPYRAGPKTRELEQFEFQKKLLTGFIEPTISEWPSPVLFAPKEDCKL